MLNVCDLINCGYYYRGEDDDYPCCHFPDNECFPAPCEYDDEQEDEDDDVDDSYTLADLGSNWW